MFFLVIITKIIWKKQVVIKIVQENYNYKSWQLSASKISVDQQMIIRS